MQGERGDPSSSQNLPAAAACLTAFSLFLLPNEISNKNQQRIPLKHVRES
jgi:hypothetical protein